MKELEELNKKAVEIVKRVRSKYEGGETKIIVSGMMGPRGDGYNLDIASRMNGAQAEEYHSVQIKVRSWIK